ncbi:MAG: argininosuccinate synthase [bacterium]|nr:argininosuccinate synthase [bacterium]
MKTPIEVKKKGKVVLAFSGGLDTSFCVLYLKEQGFDVITLTVDTGGFDKEEARFIAQRAKKLGVLKHYFVDGRENLYNELASYIIKGNILRGGVYPLSAGPERLVIATKLVEVAAGEKAHYVAHGSTSAGNDQVRFDVTIKVLNPKLEIIAPIRDSSITREKEIEFLEGHGVSVPKITKSYSINKGMLGVTVAGKETKGSWETPSEDAFPDIPPLAKTPNKPVNLTIEFKTGLPTGINGKAMPGVQIMEHLNKIGGEHSVGKGVHLGNTILGIKGRIAFAAPAATILIKAHKELEKLVLTKWQLFWKDLLSDFYGNLLHEALYFDPVMRDLEAFIDSSQTRVDGKVKIKLFKGNIVVEGVESLYSLMNPEIGTYGEESALWDGQDAQGFIKIYGLQSVLAANAAKLGKKQ